MTNVLARLTTALREPQFVEDMLRLYRRTVGRRRYQADLPARVHMPSPADQFILDTRTTATANFCHKNIHDGELRYEPVETSLFVDMAKAAAGIVVDAGAHIGYYSLLSAAIASVQRVYAFETLDHYANEIERHLAENRVHHVEVVRGALGRDGQNLEFGNFLDRSCRTSISLDGYLPNERPRVHVLKVDVEGAEFDVLRGASAVLTADRPALLIGVHPSLLATKFDASVEHLVTYLTDHDYRLYYVRPESRDGVVTSDGAAPKSVGSFVDRVQSGVLPTELDSEGLFTLVGEPADSNLWTLATESQREW